MNMGCSETGFADGLVWSRKVKFGLSLLFQIFLPATICRSGFEVNRLGVREECSESLGYICLSISGAALLAQHTDIRLAISDSFSGDMIRDTLHSKASARCRHHVYICLSAFGIRKASL